MKTLFRKLIVSLLVLVGTFVASSAIASPNAYYIGTLRAYQDSNHVTWGWVAAEQAIPHSTTCGAGCAMFYFTQPSTTISMMLATAKSMKQQKVAVFYGTGSCANGTTQWGEFNDTNSGCYISAVELFREPNLLPSTPAWIPFDIYADYSGIYYATTCASFESYCTAGAYYGVPSTKRWKDEFLYTSGFAAPAGTGRDSSYGMVTPATAELLAAFSGKNKISISGGSGYGTVGGYFGVLPITDVIASDY